MFRCIEKNYKPKKLKKTLHFETEGVRIKRTERAILMRQYFLFSIAQCMTFNQIQLGIHMLSDSVFSTSSSVVQIKYAHNHCFHWGSRWTTT